MSDCVIAVAKLDAEALRPKAEAHLDRARRFYEPLGLTHESRVWLPRLRMLAWRLDASPLTGAPGAWTFGEDPPAPLADPGACVAAGADQLATLSGSTAIFAFDDEARRARIVATPSGPALLYGAADAGIACWSTHAVAAGLIARGRATVDAGAVPQLIAFDFVGGRRTLVDGVHAIEHGVSVEIDPVAALEQQWVTPRERWRLEPEPDAQQAAERALLESTAQRFSGRSVAIALTAGLDSRVAAVALQSTDADCHAFTWGAANWDDPRGAQQIADALGIPHEVGAMENLDSGDVLREHDRAVRWADGVFALAPLSRRWPAADVVVGGMGGEIGRSFYYDDWSAWLAPRPQRADLTLQLRAQDYLRGADAEAIASVDAAVGSWFDDAEQTGVDGWRHLDVVYADQRVRRWGRAQLPCMAAPLAPGFTAPQLTRALVSQSLAARLGSGFHHAFLDWQRPDLALARREPPSMPPALLRSYHRARDRRRKSGVPGLPDEPGDSFAANLWAERPDARDWVLEEAIPDPLAGGALGPAWTEWARTGFPRGARRAGEQARLAAGAVALARALAALE